MLTDAIFDSSNLSEAIFESDLRGLLNEHSKKVTFDNMERIVYKVFTDYFKTKVTDKNI